MLGLFCIGLSPKQKMKLPSFDKTSKILFFQNAICNQSVSGLKMKVTSKQSMTIGYSIFVLFVNVSSLIKEKKL